MAAVLDRGRVGQGEVSVRLHAAGGEFAAEQGLDQMLTELGERVAVRCRQA